MPQKWGIFVGMSQETRKTIYYREKFDLKFPIPLLAYEVLQYRMSELGDDFEPEDLQPIYDTVLTQVCGVADPQADDYVYLVEAIKEVIASGTNEQPATSKGDGKRAYSSEFYKYFGLLPTDTTCLQVCGFDYEKARVLYCEVDRTIAMEIISQYVTRLQNDHTIMLESCVYGFGGNLDGASSDTITLDDTEEGAADFFSAVNTRI